MKGSEKQIKWADDIKANMKPDFDNLRSQLAGNAIALKAINFVENLDLASFWIENRDSSPMTMLNEMVQSGLRIMGCEYSHNAKFNQSNGEITITWTEIVDDGKGGHEETREEVI